MSHLSSANIVINSVFSTGIQCPASCNLANSPVLDYLMPQLSLRQTDGLKPQQRLENIDAYMLLETEQLLERVGSFCVTLGLSESTTFYIKLTQSKLRISGQFEQKNQLVQLVAQDPWIMGAFNWLHGNYCALAYSQELLSFAKIYEKNPQQALAKYRHFEAPNQGMDCYLSAQIKDGKAKLRWLVESPVVIYFLKG